MKKNIYVFLELIAIIMGSCLITNGAIYESTDTNPELSVNVLSMPIKTSYYEGEEFDLSGLVFEEIDKGVAIGIVSYSEESKDDFRVTPKKLNSKDIVVTVEYRDLLSFDIPVTVVAAEDPGTSRDVSDDPPIIERGDITSLPPLDPHKTSDIDGSYMFLCIIICLLSVAGLGVSRKKLK